MQGKLDNKDAKRPCNYYSNELNHAGLATQDKLNFRISLDFLGPKLNHKRAGSDRIPISLNHFTT